jgi:AcrR family transcriptional regulator
MAVKGGSREAQEQRRTPAGLRRRSELMEAAVGLVAENGFGRTRISDIVGRVGVGQGVF